MKQRLKATHFIEIWKAIKSCNYHTSYLTEIGGLEYALGATTMNGLGKTIALWKIKFK